MEGAWFVPSLPPLRGGGREGRSDVWETEGAQSAVARGLETAARGTALCIVPAAPLFNYNFLYDLHGINLLKMIGRLLFANNDSEEGLN